VVDASPGEGSEVREVDRLARFDLLDADPVAPQFAFEAIDDV
jgi:hypothetical protein